MILPNWAVPALLKVMRANRAFVTTAGAEQRIAEREMPYLATEEVVHARPLLEVAGGEGQGEALVCEATNRGPRLLPLIERLRSCPPAPGLALHPLAQGSGALPGLALQGIASGQACTMEP